MDMGRGFSGFKFGLAVLTACTCGAQINLSGRVINASGAPLANVTVELIGFRQIVRTDANGRYSFSGTPVLPRPFAGSQPIIQGGRLHFSVPGGPEPVRLLLLNARGQKQLVLESERLAGGRHSVDLNSRLSGIPFTGARFYQLLIGEKQYVFKEFHFGLKKSGEAITAQEARPLAKGAAADSLHFNLQGYEDDVLAVTGPDAGALPDMTLRPGIAFQQYYAGTGVVRDISTGQDVRITKEKMYHVIYLPEGYTQADLDAGRYQADVVRWYNDVFRISPISTFKEAFVIWTLPVPSAERTGGNTYFRLDFGGTPQDGSTAQKLWDILKRHPFAPKYFDGSTARNWVVQFAILDPASLRSGYSGHASSYTNPTNSSQRVNTAHAQTHHHEFFHSFARVSDEYYDAGHGAASANRLNNLAPSTNCADLPWKHLVYGAEYNKSSDSLVGAFGGTPGRYHPEFKCLMNGSHDNALIFGGSNNLRTMDRLCNWCRELSLFRLYHGMGMMAGSASTAFTAWEQTYRRPYWQAYPFFVPNPTPQTNSEGRKWFMPCGGPGS